MASLDRGQARPLDGWATRTRCSRHCRAWARAWAGSTSAWRPSGHHRGLTPDSRGGAADPADGADRVGSGCSTAVSGGRADGRLDYEDELLARFDLVVASVHVARRQPRAELTRRTLNAIHSPHVDVIAHPSGRMIQSRDDLDLDWDAVFEAAAATGTALEINGSPHRLDLAGGAQPAAPPTRVASWRSTPDAHRTQELDYVRWGVDQAAGAGSRPAMSLTPGAGGPPGGWPPSRPGSDGDAACRRCVPVPGRGRTIRREWETRDEARCSPGASCWSWR